ncbi:hypothetical protein ABT010_38905 [Streptomyces sp. NPDC002668]
MTAVGVCIFALLIIGARRAATVADITSIRVRRFARQRRLA